MRHISEAELHPVSAVPAANPIQYTGAALVIMSAVAFSTAGIFTKAVAADAWSVIFWRGVSAVAFTLVFLVTRSGLRRELRCFRTPAVIATLLMASGTAAFIPAFKLTSVANVSVIWATSPFVAAFLAWVFIREVPAARTLACSVLALIGVLITVRGSFVAGGVTGDLLALWMTLMMAGTMVIYRAYPDTPTKLPAALSALILLPVAMTYAAPTQVVGPEIGILAAFGLVFAAASVLLAKGSSRVPSAKAALLSVIETPLAPIWAFLILAEMPSVPTLVGGSTVMVAVIYAQKSANRVQPPKQIALGTLPCLNTHLRKDVGFDDAHALDRSTWRNPLTMEIRRLHDRL